MRLKSFCHLETTKKQKTFPCKFPIISDFNHCQKCADQKYFWCNKTSKGPSKSIMKNSYLKFGKTEKSKI